MYNLEVKRFFEACHMLPDSGDLVTKQCANLHGHTYLAIVRFSSTSNDRGGMVVDFKGIKHIVDELDHTTIIQNTPFGQQLEALVNGYRELQNLEQQEFVLIPDPPTAENIAKHIHKRISEIYPDLGHLEVTIIEGFKGELNASSASYQN